MECEDGDFSASLMGMLDSMDRPCGSGEQQVFHCTLDDIGTCEADGIRGCVGYVADKKQWDRFNYTWDVALSGYGLNYLHTSHFLHRVDRVGEPSRSDLEDFQMLEPFLNVVRQQLLDQDGFGVIVITECAGYEALTKAEKSVIRPPLRHSFEILIGAVCGAVSTILSRANPIAFEVDETDVPDTAAGLLQSFITLKKQNDQYRASLGGLCFVDDKMLRAAQAADMLGNMTIKGWRRRQADGAWAPAIVPLVSRSDGTIVVRTFIHDGASLKKIAANRLASQQKITPIATIDAVGRID